MGANYDGRVFKTSDFEEACRLWDDAVSNSQCEDGNHYSGAIGMLCGKPKQVLDKVFGSPDEAEEFISETHQKWDVDPIAVRCRAVDEAAKVKADTARQEAHARLYHLELALAKDLVSAAGEFLECRKCRSRLNTKHRRFSRLACDVCGDCYGLLSESDMASIEAAQAEIDATKDVNCAAADGTWWVIGGTCPS